MRSRKSFQQTFQEQKAEASQSYQLAHTATEAGRKLSLTGNINADGDYHIQDQSQYLRMIAFVRMMERNDPVIASARRRLMHNVNVGQMTVGPDTGEPLLNEHLKGRWKEWSEDPDLCDVTSRMNFEAMADIAYIRTIFDGDVFAVPRESDGALQNLESHRCQTPHYGKLDRGACGVQVGDRGEVVRYYLTQKSTGYGQVVRVADVEPIDARNAERWRNVFHVFQPDRFSLNRGVTSLAPVGPSASRRDDLEFATVLTAQIKSCITFIEEVNDPALMQLMAQNGAMPVDPVEATFTEKDAAGFEMRTAQIHPGRVLSSRPGHKLTMQSPAITTEGQLQLNDLLIEYLAMCIDLPSIVLRLDAKHANFSQYRNVLDQARMTYGKHQRWFSQQYHRRVYRNNLRIWSKTDDMIRSYLKRESPRTLRQSAVLKHEWHSIGWKYCQPVDDATGDLILLGSSMMSSEQYARQRYGISAEELAKQVVSGNKFRILLAIKAAQEIKEETGVEVDWMHLAPPATRSGLNIQLMGQDLRQSAGENQ